MRAMDCSHPAHAEDAHFTADTDDDLIEQVKRHRDQYHPEITDDQVRELVTANAYDE